MDLLASMPITRRRVLLEKSGAMATDLGLLSIVLFASTCLASLVFGLGIPVLYVLNGTIAMFLIGLELGLVSLAISAMSGRRTLAVGVSAGLAGASYLLYLMAQLVESVRPLRVLSPFYQAISAGPLGASLPPIVWSMLAVGIVVLAAAVPVFERRDLAV